jgi:predicted dehydrogenase
MSAELANGALGLIHATRFATGNANEIRVSLYGDEGGLMVHTDGRTSSLLVCTGPDVDKNKWREVKTPAVPTTYQRFAKALRTGNNGDPSFRRAADIQRVLDLCLEGGDQVVGPVKRR